MSRGRPRKFDKEKALNTALKLFWEHGYEGVSVALLANEIGINIPSLYSAFGNKEALFIKAVEHYGELNGKMYHDAFKKKTAKEVAKAILLGEVELVTRRGSPDGCLMIQGALATGPEAKSVQLMMARQRKLAEKWVEERFKRAQKDGDLPKSANPAHLASFIMTLNSGIAVQAKSGSTKKELEHIVEIAMKGWPA